MEYLSIIKRPIEAEYEEFIRYFQNSLHSDNALINSVIEHIMKRNGKMMRPLLLLLVAKLLGKPNEKTYYAATSLELLHNASLVHDDIVDESGERRGQLSVNARFNNKVAVLSGDFLLATSLVQVAKTLDHEIIALVAQLGQDLADGEILQLSNISSTNYSEEVYFDVIRKKTAVLFSACCQAAAISVNADKDIVEKAYLLGEYIGICFQIRDDIFDYYSDASIGKPTGNDMKEGKITLPLLYMVNNTTDDKIKSLVSKVKSCQATEEEIAYLVNYTKEGGGIAYAKDIMLNYRQRALDLFAHINNEDIKKALQAYIDFVVMRDI